MISGYVIFFSSKNGTTAKFAVSRALRLYPAYWFAVLFTSLFALLWGGDLMSVHLSQIVINLSMLQHFVGVRDVDGVYWTLAYEITFYFAVSVLLLLGFQKKLDNLFMLWPLLLAASLVLGLKSWPLLGGYYYFFAAGALFGILKQEFRWRAVFSLLLTYVLCIQFSIGYAAKITLEKSVVFSPIVVSVVITAFFALFLYQNTYRGQSHHLPFSRLFGALTYPVYLIHAHFGYMFINRFATNENRIWIYALTIVIVISTALFIHYFIERRLSSHWRRLFTSTIGRLAEVLENTAAKMRNEMRSH